MWPIQLAFLLFIVHRIFLPSLTNVTLLHFSHDRSNWSPSLTSNTFQNFPRISDPFSEVFKIQHHTKLRSKYSKPLISSSNLSPLYWWHESSYYSMLLWPRKSENEFHMYYLHSMGHEVAQLVEALRYKPEGRYKVEGPGFNSRWCHWSFVIDIILSTSLLPWGRLSL